MLKGDMQVKSVAVIFGDNDFRSTFAPLMETLHRAICYHREKGGLSREQVVQCVRLAALSHYAMFQHPVHGGSDPMTEKKIAHIAEYFAYPCRILFDEAADKDALDGDHNSSSFYLHVSSGQISVY